EDPKFVPDWKTWPNDSITLSWLGQSTVLINFYGAWILTDPVFSERVGIPVGPITVGPRRMVHAPLQAEDLPPIDLILISHAHMDHTDLPSLRALALSRNNRSRNPKMIVAANTRLVYKELPFQDVQELDWGERQTISLQSDLNVEAIETRHAGWRMPWQPCRSRNEDRGMSYNAYLVKTHDAQGNPHAFVFGGDTGYTKSFHRIGERLRSEHREVDCAIMPIGTYNPWVRTHCNPEQAWRMTLEMNAKTIVPIHWNTYMQSSEPRYEPIEWLRHTVQQKDAIALTEHGQTWALQETVTRQFVH